MFNSVTAVRISSSWNKQLNPWLNYFLGIKENCISCECQDRETLHGFLTSTPLAKVEAEPDPTRLDTFTLFASLLFSILNEHILNETS